MSVTKEQIIEAVATMSVMEVMELITAMEEKFGVSITNTSISTGTNTENSETIETIEEQTEFNVVLKAIGANKIAVIKAVRSAINLGLKEAKDLVESAPAVLKEGINKNDAEILKKTLEEAGADIEIK